VLDRCRSFLRSGVRLRLARLDVAVKCEGAFDYLIHQWLIVRTGCGGIECGRVRLLAWSGSCYVSALWAFGKRRTSEEIREKNDDKRRKCDSMKE
jgi:hypothetical protein